MPFYEYECQSCKYYTEVMQKISDPPLAKCPSCGKKALKKLISAPVFRLKGGGWYETDFKSDKEDKRNLAGADREESGGESKSEDAKTEPVKAAADAKPAADTKSSSGQSSGQSGESKASGGRSASRGSKSVKATPSKPARPARPAAKAASRKPAKPAKKPPARKARR